jgi:hypothetical protein
MEIQPNSAGSAGSFWGWKGMEENATLVQTFYTHAAGGSCGR